MHQFRNILLFCLLIVSPQAAECQDSVLKNIPFLNTLPVVDGDLTDWKHLAFCEGEWDLERLRQSAWFDSTRNRLVRDQNENQSEIDLSTRYYMAWDINFLYFGAEVKDNVNDVFDIMHESKRWYYKDAIAWFVEAPSDDVSEKFGEGDHAFCFVIDTTKPDYGAWWRHGTDKEQYIEEVLPASVVDYEIRMNPWNRSKADYILEARVKMSHTLAEGNDFWAKSQVGDTYRMMIVHCDPDGGEYGGHLLIYGRGDDDSTWLEFKLTD